jgi:dihydroxyacetone kinase-like predicted kinase
MTTAFQPNGFQANAFQVDPVTGFISTTDDNDTALLNGAVALPAGVIDTIDSNDLCAIIGTVEIVSIDTHDGFTPEEIRRARRLDAKIRAKQEALRREQEEAKKRRKQQISDLVDPQPIAKVKQSKLKSKQEDKADIPSVEELEQSIAYLENQRSRIVQAVELRQQQAFIQAQLAILEAQRLAELDDEESILMLI